MLVLDVAMPEGGALEVLDQLRTLRPDLRILILSMYPERRYAVRALRARAAGYLTKESAPEELISAIRQVAWGGKHVTQSLGERMVAELSGEAEEEPHEALSDREYQVVHLLAAGKAVTEIASELSLAVRTISTYRIRILRKLRLRNTAEIIYYAFERGLAE